MNVSSKNDESFIKNDESFIRNGTYTTADPAVVLDEWRGRRASHASNIGSEDVPSDVISGQNGPKMLVKPDIFRVFALLTGRIHRRPWRGYTCPMGPNWHPSAAEGSARRSCASKIYRPKSAQNRGKTVEKQSKIIRKSHRSVNSQTTSGGSVSPCGLGVVPTLYATHACLPSFTYSKHAVAQRCADFAPLR